MSLDAPVLTLPGVGPKTAETLGALGIETVADLLHRLPRGYEDRSRITPVVGLTPGEVAVVRGSVVAVRQGRRRGRRPGAIEARVDDGTGALTVTFFKPPSYLAKQWTRGRRVLVMGRTERGPGLRLSHPEFRFLDEGEDAAPTDAIAPFYATPEGMGQRAYRKLVRAACGLADDAGVLPVELRGRLALPGRADALAAIHFPAAGSDVDALRAGTSRAHEALLLEDLFVLQVALLWRRARHAADGAASDALPRGRMGGARARATVRARAVAALPFTLTDAQERVLAEIDVDLARSGMPMQRLVQGDVGAGKTAVGLLAAAPILERGGQVAVLAPTEILARQWLVRARSLYRPLGFAVEWLAGGQGAPERRDAEDRIASGKAALVVGTHAVFSDQVEFARLALAVVDEQQRFGVFQRVRLLAKGPQPHLLALSATPIPRSLARTLFGDLDLSVLDERPHRGERVTTLLPSARRRVAFDAVGEAVERGERAYVVCPRIQGPSGDVLRSAVATAEELANGPLRGVPLGLVHGAMDAAGKEAALAAFRAGRIQVLVGTSVLEVGLDVPEATVMVVENAERFGLSQLHQLRGRVGRSDRGGTCFLLTPSPEDASRLAVLARTDDGFEVAEEDLRQRGPGDVVGARQAGRPAFRLALTPRFFELLEVARDEAARRVADPAFEDDDGFAELRAAAEARLEASRAVEAG